MNLVDRKSILLIFVFVVSVFISNAQQKDSSNFYKNADSSVRIYNKRPTLGHLLLPGGTHFFEGKIGKGLVYSISEVGLISAGIFFDDKLKERNESEYYNFPLIIGQQLYIIDKGEFFIKEFSKFADKKGFAYDNVSPKEMYRAPFDFKEIKKPLVLSFIGFGIIDAIISYSIGSQKISDIERVYSYGSEFNAKWGTSVYIGTSGLASYGAGLSEEMMMRGLLLPAMDYRFGRNTGLITTSLLFSALHIPSYVETTDPLKQAYVITEITSIGFIFGKNAQNNNYNIKTVIAAHAWFDFSVMLTSWILNPKENPLGFHVSFRL